MTCGRNFQLAEKKSSADGCKDKYGLSWQIVPTVFFEMIEGPDAARKERVMKAMMRMTKFVIAGLEAAYRDPAPST